MKNKLDIIDWFLVIALGFSLIMGTMISYGQELKGVTIDKSEIVTITFEDGSRDRLYQNTDDGGVELVYIPKGELKLTPKEYERFVKLIKKAFKRTTSE